MSIIDYIKHLFSEIKQQISKRITPKKKQNETIREAIEELIEEDDAFENGGESSIDEEEREILGNVLNLRDIQVQDIMVPRIEIKALPITSKIDELMASFVESQVSSILVYQGNIDNIIGVIYLKEALGWSRIKKTFNINLLIKEVLFVPPTMKTLDLLLQMKETGTKVAVVVDEYGGIEGFVSFGDLVEEIIGDIQSAEEQSNEQTKIVRNTDGTYIVDAKTTLSEIDRVIGLNIVSLDNSVDSLGGYVFEIAGRVPARGELIFCEKNNIEFEILEADQRRIKLIKLRKN